MFPDGWKADMHCFNPTKQRVRQGRDMAKARYLIKVPDQDDPADRYSGGRGRPRAAVVSSSRGSSPVLDLRFATLAKCRPPGKEGQKGFSIRAHQCSSSTSGACTHKRYTAFEPHRDLVATLAFRWYHSCGRLRGLERDFASCIWTCRPHSHHCSCHQHLDRLTSCYAGDPAKSWCQCFWGRERSR